MNHIRQQFWWVLQVRIHDHDDIGICKAKACLDRAFLAEIAGQVDGGIVETGARRVDEQGRLAEGVEVDVLQALKCFAAGERGAEFLGRHADQVNVLLEQSSKTSFIPELASESSDRALAARVQAFALKAIAPAARGDANASISRINYLADLRGRLAPAIGAWIKAH